MASSKLPINEGVAILNRHFGWNKAKMVCLVGMLVGLPKTLSINLAEIATGLAGDVGLMSRYQRQQRFVHSHRIRYEKVAGCIMTLFGFTG